MYLDPLSKEQKEVYENKIRDIRENARANFSWMSVIQSLNIVFPEGKTGDEGFDHCFIEHNAKEEKQCSYKTDMPRFLTRPLISQYSTKINQILSCIEKSTGIVLIYSQYLKSGILSMALALEEAGYQRYGQGSYNLLKNPTHPQKAQGSYILITGQTVDAEKMVTVASSMENKNGEKIKVILISEAGSEGIDFKNIRQVHIMEPWYNLNRMEQVIGRAVRFKSHCALPFEERNVEIYLHTAYTEDNVETMDAFIYRAYAEPKALQMGKLNRLLKQTAVDLYLNLGQMNMTVDDLMTLSANQHVAILISSTDSRGRRIEIQDYPMGDKPYTAVCDYNASCKYSPAKKRNLEENVVTFTPEHLQTTRPLLMRRIQGFFRDYDFLTRDEIVAFLNHGAQMYSLEEIYSVLIYLVSHPNEMWMNRKGKWGYLLQQGNVFLFQPRNQKDEHLSTLERLLPPLKQTNSILITLEPSQKKQRVFELSSQRLAALIHHWNQIVASTWGENSEFLEPIIGLGEEHNKGVGKDKWYQVMKHTYVDEETTTDINLMKFLLTVGEVNSKFLNRVMFHHYIETLNIEDKFVFLAEALQNPQNYPEITQYFQKRCRVNAKHYTLMDVQDKQTYYFSMNLRQNEGVKWVTSTLELSSLNKLYSNQVNQISKHKVFGCIDFNEKENQYALKLKQDKKDNYHKGAFCSNKNKNVIQEDMRHFPFAPLLENLKKHLPNMQKEDQCTLVEIMLRLYDENDPSRRCFLSPEEFFN